MGSEFTPCIICLTVISGVFCRQTASVQTVWMLAVRYLEAYGLTAQKQPLTDLKMCLGVPLCFLPEISFFFLLTLYAIVSALPNHIFSVDKAPPEPQATLSN